MIVLPLLLSLLGLNICTVCTICTDRTVCTLCVLCAVCITYALEYVQYAHYVKYVQIRCVQCDQYEQHVSIKVCTYVRMYLVPGTWYAPIRVCVQPYALISLRHASMRTICLHTPAFCIHMLIFRTFNTHVTTKSNRYQTDNIENI